jgi:hypothetical protein
MTFRGWRLAFKMQRLELLLFLAGAVVLVVASLLIAWGTTEVRAGFLACMERLGPEANCSPSSPSLNDFSLWGGFAKLGAFLTPFALGLVLGVPVVAREIEGRTAGIAWTLSRSRLRWLVLRVAPLVVGVVLLTALVGVASEFVTRANPFADYASNPGFADYTSRGVLLPVRALAVLLLAIAVGAMVPRQLPALLLAAGVTLAMFVGLTLGMDAWMTTEAEPIPIDQAQLGGPRIFDVAYRDDASGEVISMNDFYNRYGDVAIPDDQQNPPGFTQVAMGIPGDEYWPWVLRESAILGALALGSSALAFVVVQRRRPS